MIEFNQILHIYALILTRSMLGLSPVIFLQICTRVMALDLCQNFVSAQYLANKSIEFHPILYMNYIDKT